MLARELVTLYTSVQNQITMKFGMNNLWSPEDILMIWKLPDVLEGTTVQF